MRLHRTLTVMACFLGVGLILAGDDSREEATKKDRAKLQGTWKAVAYEMDGSSPLPEDQVGSIKATIDASGKVTVQFDGNTIIEATTKIDPTKKPKTIDITFTEGDLKGQSTLGIYEVTEDTYRYCRAEPGKERPKEFSAKAGSGNVLVQYKREKP